MPKDAWLQWNVDKKETVVSMAKIVWRKKKAVAIPATVKPKGCADLMEPNAYPPLKGAPHLKCVKSKDIARMYLAPKIGRPRTADAKRMHKDASNLIFARSMDNVALQTARVLQR